MTLVQACINPQGPNLPADRLSSGLVVPRDHNHPDASLPAGLDGSGTLPPGGVMHGDHGDEGQPSLIQGAEGGAQGLRGRLVRQRKAAQSLST